jgi:predicted GNAT family acetyltransferase
MLELTTKPTEKHLREIQVWLKEELDNTDKGFYVNWDMIFKAFNEKRLSIITERNYAIGFVVYRIYDLTAVIDIAEIKPAERKKGIGKKIIEETLEFFKSKKVLVVELFCSPESSESFWKKIDFLNFPEYYRSNKINMYKSLVETLKHSKELTSKNGIQLWDDKPNRTRDSKPNWTWELNFIENKKTLSKPIIFPAMNDWKVKLIINGEEIFEDELNYLESDKSDYGSFMIIEEIKL